MDLYWLFLSMFSFAECWCTLTKATATLCILVTVLSEMHQDELHLHYNGTWLNLSQTTSASGFSDWISICLSGHLHLFLAQSTCDPIALDAF